jgi:translation initiation factor IF-2
MARKRIKSLAKEWGVPLEDVIASCERLKLAHAHSDASLLGPEEADRVKADLDEQAHRNAVLRKETVVETSAGTIVEKRLNATVMRRRHAETGPAPAGEAAQPFHFETQEAAADDTFVSPFMTETSQPQIDLPVFQPVIEPAVEAPQPETPVFTAPEVSAPTATQEPSIEAHAAEIHEAPNPVEVEAPLPSPEVSAKSENGAGAEMHAEARETAPPAVTAAPPRAEAPRMQAPRAEAPRAEAPRIEPSRPMPPALNDRRDFRRPEVSSRLRVETRPPQVVAPSSVNGERRTVNLTKTGSHPAAPSLDDGQRGPKVLGKIDLRAKVAPPKPAAPTGRTVGPGRPGQPAGRPQAGAPQPQQQPDGPPPEPSNKPGAAGRALKKKKVVKKDGGDFLAEREIRGLRVPKKRRALPGKEQRKTEITTPRASKRVVRITEGVTVGDLGRSMGVKAGDLIRKLMDLGQMATLNQVLDVDTASLLASEFGYTVENVAFDVEQAIEEAPDEQEEAGEMVTRPPVVTIMGHVDHGKTSLLDAIRSAKVTEEEYGGITQHIGAYTVQVDGRTITFVDTPGHEAFTSMRARGAKVTDIVVLVVAANEGPMPQTIEALNHARAAKVPIIVAINKIDLPDANLDNVKQKLTQIGLIPEDFGGDAITVGVSARTKEGIDKLLEMILLQADVMELKANPNRPAKGTVVESQLDRGRGPVATVLIQEGTLHQGDPFVCGVSYGRVRAMLNHLGQRLTEAGPSTPVEIFGLSSVPEPGTQFVGVAEEAKARQVAEFRRSRQREGELQKTSRVSLEDLSQRMREGEVKDLKVIIKGDVQGSVEALQNALERMSTTEVKLQVIHASAGAISETDVTLASASKGLIIGFNIRPEAKAAQLAEKEGVEIRLYTVIYEAIDDVREAMEGLLAPTFREKALGRAEVRKTFNVPGGTIAGSMVLDGKITRAGRARLVRDGRVVWEGKIGSLKRFKDDAREVAAGYECGIGLENFNDVKPGDVVEAFEMETVLRKLTPPPREGRGSAQVEKQPPA